MRTHTHAHNSAYSEPPLCACVLLDSRDPMLPLHGWVCLENGGRNLQEFIARGWLVKDQAPSYYIYAQRMGDHLQVGQEDIWMG